MSIISASFQTNERVHLDVDLRIPDAAADRVPQAVTAERHN